MGFIEPYLAQYQGCPDEHRFNALNKPDEEPCPLCSLPCHSQDWCLKVGKYGDLMLHGFADTCRKQAGLVQLICNDLLGNLPSVIETKLNLGSNTLLLKTMDLPRLIFDIMEDHLDESSRTQSRVAGVVELNLHTLSLTGPHLCQPALLLDSMETALPLTLNTDDFPNPTRMMFTAPNKLVLLPVESLEDRTWVVALGEGKVARVDEVVGDEVKGQYAKTSLVEQAIMAALRSHLVDALGMDESLVKGALFEPTCDDPSPDLGPHPNGESDDAGREHTAPRRRHSRSNSWDSGDGSERASEGVETDHAIVKAIVASSVTDHIKFVGDKFCLYGMRQGFWDVDVETDVVAAWLMENYKGDHNTKTTKSLQGITGMTRVARLLKFNTKDDDFHSKLDLLEDGLVPFNNGMYSVATDSIRAFTPEDKVTSGIGYNWIPRAEVPSEHFAGVQKFYEEVLPVEEERLFFQRMHAKAMFGKIGKHFLVMMDLRDGYNSKSTMMKLQQYTFGTLAADTDESFLYSSKEGNANSANPTLLNYKFRKLAFFEEPDNKRAMDMTKFKKLTGGDAKMSGRRNFSNITESFIFTAFIVIAINEGGMPHISATQIPFENRMKVMPMRSKFVPPSELALMNPVPPYTFPMDENIAIKLQQWKVANFYLLKDVYTAMVEEEVEEFGPVPTGCHMAKGVLMKDSDR